jgi:hypothetical protein
MGFYPPHSRYSGKIISLMFAWTIYPPECLTGKDLYQPPMRQLTHSFFQA